MRRGSLTPTVSALLVLGWTLVAGCGQRANQEEGFSAPQESDFASETPPRTKAATKSSEPRVPPEVLAAMGHGDAAPAAVATDAGSGPEAGAAPTDGSAKLARTPELSPEAKALAKTVTEAAAQTAEDPCEQSFNALKGLARAANRAVPRRADYLQVCGELPREMRRCLIPGYRVEHRETCERTRDAVDPELLGRLRSVIATPSR